MHTAPLAPDPVATIASGAARLRVSGLTVRYGPEPALEAVDLRLEAGSICALVGLNGAGKSTLFRALMGFLAPSAGTMAVDGLPVAQAQRRQWVAYVPQDDQVPWDFPLRVWDVVMMGRYGRMNLLRWPDASDRQAVAEALGRVELAELRERPIGALSGGQRKRALLARAIAQRGRLLLLDEPFTGVDRRSEGLIIDQLRELRDDGASVLIATHDLDAIPGFCDQVVLLNRRVLASGATAAVFTQANLLRTFGAPAGLER
ncbi:MAG: metal ABC transporter ATP-binding protein [Cyanobium sp.]